MESRKSYILESVIEDYIKTGVAVSSNHLSIDHRLEVSPATIRSELATLEKEGYLTHLHTSSGRVPTDKGYRYYVDSFIKPRALPRQEKEKILQTYEYISTDMDIILSHTALILSEFANCFCVITAPELSRNLIKMIKIILINIHQLMIVLMTTHGHKDFIINSSEELDETTLETINNLLNKFLSNKDLNDIKKINVEEIVRLLPEYKELLKNVIGFLQNANIQNNKPVLYKQGTAKLLSYDDFQDINQLRDLISVLEKEKDYTDLLLNNPQAQDDVDYVIGAESPIEPFKNCALAQIQYNAGDGSQGKMAVIGPKRLRYSYVANLLKTISGSLAGLITKINKGSW